jgi:hypothetical protein
VGAVTPGIHLRWLPGASVEFPRRERTLGVKFRPGDEGRWAWWLNALCDSISNSQPSIPRGESRGTSNCTPSNTFWPTASSGRAGQVPLDIRRNRGGVAAPLHAGFLGDDLNREPVVDLPVSKSPPSNRRSPPLAQARRAKTGKELRSIGLVAHPRVNYDPRAW